MIGTRSDEAAMREMASKLLAGGGNGDQLAPPLRPVAPTSATGAKPIVRQKFSDHPGVVSACELNARRLSLIHI